MGRVRTKTEGIWYLGFLFIFSMGALKSIAALESSGGLRAKVILSHRGNPRAQQRPIKRARDYTPRRLGALGRAERAHERTLRSGKQPNEPEKCWQNAKLFPKLMQKKS